MPILLKQILSGFMIAGDALLMFFATSLIGTNEASIGVFMLLFLAVDAYLSVDYIIHLQKQSVALDHQKIEEKVAAIHAEAEDDELEAKRDELDDALAEDVRNADDVDPDELKEMLSKDHLTEDEEKKS